MNIDNQHRYHSPQYLFYMFWFGINENLETDGNSHSPKINTIKGDEIHAELGGKRIVYSAKKKKGYE